MAGEPRPGDPRRARRTGHGPSAPPRTPRRIPAPSSGSKSASHHRSVTAGPCCAGRRAARCGRRGRRRTAAAGRSSPIDASGPGRRPPRCSRSRRAIAGARDPTRTDRAAPGTRRRARRARRARPTAAAASSVGQVLPDDIALALDALDGHRDQLAGLQEFGQELDLRRRGRAHRLVADARDRPDPELARAGPARAGRSPGSATATCAGTGRAGAGSRRAAPAGKRRSARS